LVIHPPILYYISLHTVSDSAAFAIIIGFGLKTGLNASAMAMERPSIIKTIVHDATVYFFFIFSSHLVFVVTLVSARVSDPHNRFIRFPHPLLL